MTCQPSVVCTCVGYSYITLIYGIMTYYAHSTYSRTLIILTAVIDHLYSIMLCCNYKSQCYA